MPQKQIPFTEAVPLDLEHIELADVLDVPALQELMDDYFTLTGFAFGILDRKGEVLVAGGWQDICVKFHRAQPESCTFCHESDISLSSGVAPGTFKTYRCKNNLWDIASPIMLGERHIGNIFMGQLLFDDEEPDYELFRAQARRYGYDEASYIEALDRVPRYSRETVNTAMSFCSKLAKMISRSNYNNLILADTLAKKELAEETLNETKQMFSLFMKHSPFYTYIKEVTPTGSRVLQASDNFQQMIGIQGSEMLGKTMEELFPSEMAAKITADDWSVVSKGDVLEFEEDLNGRNYSTVKFPLALKDKNLLAGYTIDITERKQAEQLLYDKNSELERFTYTVSHDLKSPLITIQAYTGMIAKDVKAGNLARALDDLKRIETAASKMNALLADLLELSRIGRQMNESSVIDMNRLVKDTLEQLSGPLDQGKVEIVVQQDLPPVTGDQKRIAEVVQNLVENAIKYRGDQAAPRIEIGTRQDGKEIVLFVDDNGIGIDPSHHERIFGLFNKLDGNSEGTGVGLALVKRIVELHGGRVWVESEGEGKGSRFCFTIKEAQQ